MNCDEAKRLMQAELAGDASDEQRARLEAHLAECSACMALWEALSATVAAVGAARPGLAGGAGGGAPGAGARGRRGDAALRADPEARDAERAGAGDADERRARRWLLRQGEGAA